jgi:D-tyrosyl-tRNA(Tyr) deacylase
MRAVVQRVRSSSVEVGGRIVGEIESGLLVLLGVKVGDTAEDLAWMVRKVSALRIFADDEGRMNLDVGTVGGSVLLVSQFTLLGDCRRGNRPSFVDAAPPELASPMVDAAASALRERGLRVETGRFGADMLVRLENDGPVTIILDSRSDSVEQSP